MDSLRFPPGTYFLQTTTPADEFARIDIESEENESWVRFGTASTADRLLISVATATSIRLVSRTTRQTLEARAWTCGFVEWLMLEAVQGLRSLRYPRAAFNRWRRGKPSSRARLSRWRGTQRLETPDEQQQIEGLQLAEGDQLFPGARALIQKTIMDTGASSVSWNFKQRRFLSYSETVLRAPAAEPIGEFTDELQRHCWRESGQNIGSATHVHLEATLGTGPKRRLRRTCDIPRSSAGVSVILPTRDRPELLRNCLSSLDSTLRPNDELVIVDHDTEDPVARMLIDRAHSTGATVLRETGAFNFSRLVNRGIAASTQNHIALVNNDIAGLSTNWSAIVAGWLENDRVGVIGADLRYPDGRRQHVGLSLNARHYPVHIDQNTRGNGPRSLYSMPRAVYAVTGALMGFTRDTFHKAGGFDETLPSDFNDVAFCLAVRTLGLASLYLPEIRATHVESASRTAHPESAAGHAEWNRVRAKFGEIADDDPFTPARMDRDHMIWRPYNLNPGFD